MILPNALTLLRIILIPAFSYYLLFRDNIIISFSILCLAAITDWLDGLTARKLNQVSDFGIVFDPIADRILIISVVLTIYIKIHQPILLFIYVLFLREIIMLLGGFILMKKGRKVEIIYLGKLSTALLFFAFIIMLINRDIGLLLFYIGFLMSIYSGFLYGQRFIKKFLSSKL